MLNDWDNLEIIWLLKNTVVNLNSIKNKVKKILLLNKPEWIIVSKSNNQGKNVYDILPAKYTNRYYIWRLDKDSCWLLILTNDSNLVNDYSHPSNKIEKEYEVTVDRKLSDTEMELCIKWILDLDENLSFKRIQFKWIYNWMWKKFIYRVHLEEGKNRHIRRVFAFFWIKIYILKRLREWDMVLWNLKPWEFKEIDVL